MTMPSALLSGDSRVYAPSNRIEPPGHLEVPLYLYRVLGRSFSELSTRRVTTFNLTEERCVVHSTLWEVDDVSCR